LKGEGEGDSAVISKETFKNGLMAGIGTTWSLAKVIFPITALVGVLKHTPVLEGIAFLFAPLLGWFGLPGDAAIVLALGNLLNLYAAIGAILTMDLTVKSVFILAVMLSFSHNLLVETAIASKIGVKAWLIALFRLGLAFSTAAVINVVWQGGEEIAVYGLISPETTAIAAEGWGAIVINALYTALLGIVQMALIIIPIMIGIQILKDINALAFLAKLFSPFTRLLGVSDKTGITLMAGLMFGIAYGAGIIIQAAKEEKLPKKDLYLVCIFLVVCHAVVEDTLVFYPVGVNIWILLIMRLVLAIVITALTSNVWLRLSSRLKISDT